MRIRTAFVSNSSSSSYICEACDHVDGGYDGMAELGFVQCENGHIFCEDHLPEGAEKTEDQWGDTVYVAAGCPICTLAQIGDGFVAEYYLALHRTDKHALVEELKRRFGDAGAVYAFMSSVRPQQSEGGFVI